MKIKGDGLEHDGFRTVSGDNWLVLIGQDEDYGPREPHARSRSDRKRAAREWHELTGARWAHPGVSTFKGYNKALDAWCFDKRGSLNAVYDFLRSLGVRWYAAGELGEILPTVEDIPLPKVDKTVRPDFGYRNMMRAFIEFCVVNWPKMTKEAAPIDRALELMAAAREAAGQGTIYARRVAWADEFLRPLKQLRAKLAMDRKNSPRTRAYDRRGHTVELDGKLDEQLWQGMATYRQMSLAGMTSPAGGEAIAAAGSSGTAASLHRPRPPACGCFLSRSGQLATISFLKGVGLLSPPRCSSSWRMLR